MRFPSHSSLLGRTIRPAAASLVCACCAALLFAPSDALAFRIIASASGNAGIAQAPCCDTGYDGDFLVSTSPYTGMPLAPNVLNAAGSRLFEVPRTTPAGSVTTIDYGSQARASLFDIGAGAWVDVSSWDAAFTGETIEAAASARLEQTLTVISDDDLYLRPVFQIDGSMSFAAGFVSSLSFVMRATGLPETELLRIDSGAAGTTLPISDLQLFGPTIPYTGGAIALTTILTAQVTGSPDSIPEGDHFGEADAFNTLTLLGFEAYADAGLTMPVSLQLSSDSGEIFTTIPEPGTALLLGLALAGLARRGRARL